MKGVAVLRVASGSAAETAGIRGASIQDNGTIVPGDIILEVEGTPIDSVPRLSSRLDEGRVGDTIRLTVPRDAHKVDVRVTLQAGER